MKKLFLVITASAFALLPLVAQEKVQKQSQFKDNWYIQLQGGASYTFSEGHKDASFGDLVTPTVGLSLGKNFTPVFGLRLQGSGWQSKNKYGWKDDSYKLNYIQGTFDGMFNFTNFFMPYQQDRMFTLTGFAGISMVHVMHKNSVNLDGKGTRLGKSNLIAPRIGLQADFLVHENLSLNLEVSGNLLEDRFNGVVVGRAYDGMLTAMGGVTYHFGKRGFDFVDYIDPSQLNEINSKLNEQRALVQTRNSQISDLEAALAKKPQTVIQETAIEVEEVLMNAVVVFKIGSANLQDNQEINIFNAAKFFQDNPDYNCVVTGYADKATGSAAVNQKISERRAETVAKVLIDKFGINPSRITTQASGDREQPFQNDVWNRVVIFTAVKTK